MEKQRPSLPRWAGALLDRYCRRLPGLIDFRLHPRLRGLVPVGEIAEEIERCLRRHVPATSLSDRRALLMWLRSTALQLLDAVHRDYLGPQYPDSLEPGLLRLDSLPAVSVQRLATELAGGSNNVGYFCYSTLPLVSLQEAFNRLSRVDREVLAMRHFERLTREELAVVLEFSVRRAGRFYLAAVRRLLGELNHRDSLAAAV